ncbi:MAG TPA: hypothetical protein VIP29_05135 [Nitrososphaeraceae archaeon]
MSEDITKKSTCLLCDKEVDPKSKIQICSTCAIVAMSDEDFQKQDYISLLENVNPRPITEKERRMILDLYIPAREEKHIKNIKEY